jgi:hypothetical protein
MEEGKDAKIRLLKILLKAGGVEVFDRGDQIRVYFDQQSEVGQAVDMYVLKRYPELARARIKVPTPDSRRQQERVEEARLMLQDPLLGEAKIEPFSYCAGRDRSSIYYAPIEMEKDISVFLGRLRAAEEILNQIDGIDTRGFREVLDGLELPRSSVTRMALNRIFRDSPDPDELLAAIGRESRVIVSNSDWKTSRQLCEETQLPPFLKMLARLLWDETSRRYMIQAWEDLHR